MINMIYGAPGRIVHVVAMGNADCTQHVVGECHAPIGIRHADVHVDGSGHADIGPIRVGAAV